MKVPPFLESRRLCGSGASADCVNGNRSWGWEFMNGGLRHRVRSCHELHGPSARTRRRDGRYRAHESCQGNRDEVLVVDDGNTETVADGTRMRDWAVNSGRENAEIDDFNGTGNDDEISKPRWASSACGAREACRTRGARRPDETCRPDGTGRASETRRPGESARWDRWRR